MIIGKWYNVTQIVAMGERGVKEKTWGKPFGFTQIGDSVSWNLMVESVNAFHRLNWGRRDG